MAEWHKRAVALGAAGLFLITSASLSILVIIQLKKDSDARKINDGLQQALQQQQAQQQSQNQEGKLQGTKLTGFTPISSVDKLEVKDLKEGTGQEVKAGDTVTVNYTGAVAATGVIFQSSLDTGQTATFGLDQVIKGWTEGIPGMKVGGTRRLVIPSDLAYGANPPQGSGIPANAPLVFDVELISVK